MTEAGANHTAHHIGPSPCLVAQPCGEGRRLGGNVQGITNSHLRLDSLVSPRLFFRLLISMQSCTRMREHILLGFTHPRTSVMALLVPAVANGISGPREGEEAIKLAVSGSDAPWQVETRRKPGSVVWRVLYEP